MPDSDGDTLGLATLRTAVSVGQGDSLKGPRSSQDAHQALPALCGNPRAGHDRRRASRAEERSFGARTVPKRPKEAV
jgi:hypothetical protein